MRTLQRAVTAAQLEPDPPRLRPRNAPRYLERSGEWSDPAGELLGDHLDTGEFEDRLPSARRGARTDAARAFLDALEERWTYYARNAFCSSKQAEWFRALSRRGGYTPNRGR